MDGNMLDAAVLRCKASTLQPASPCLRYCRFSRLQLISPSPPSRNLGHSFAVFSSIRLDLDCKVDDQTYGWDF